jgi:hypothetical protein
MSTYPGGKASPGVYQTIINQQPPHDTYVEPFVGAGAVMRRKRAARESLGYDLDRRVILGLRRLLDHGGFFEGANKGSPVGGSYGLFVSDGISKLETLYLGAGDLVYCDPPYVLGTRLQHSRIYRYELDVAGHERLLDVLLGLVCMVQISGYWCRLYADRLRRWRSIAYPARTRRGNCGLEYLYMNYPEPRELHDYRYLGGTYREREKLHRQQVRWRRRLANMGPLERLSLMAAMRDVAGGQLEGRGVHVGR